MSPKKLKSKPMNVIWRIATSDQKYAKPAVISVAIAAAAGIPLGSAGPSVSTSATETWEQR